MLGPIVHTASFQLQSQVPVLRSPISKGTSSFPVTEKPEQFVPSQTKFFLCVNIAWQQLSWRLFESDFASVG